MKRKNCKIFKSVLLLLSCLLICPCGIFSAWAAPATTKVKHKQPKEKYIPGFRINLDVEIQDKAGLLANRCYFKTKKDKNFGFVTLFDEGSGNFKAVLPAPWINSEAVEYLFVIVNKKKQVTRTQLFTIEEDETKEAATWKDANEIEEIRLDRFQDAAETVVLMNKKLKKEYIKKLPDFQTTTQKTTMIVNTELAKDLVPMNGFYDNALITEVAASEKYGLLAEGLYTSDAVATAGGTAGITSATGAVAAGTVTAAAGISTGAIIGSALGLAAIGGGAAAIGSSSSSSSDDDHSGGGNVVVCEETATAGEDTPETHTINLGQTSGTFVFDYETYGQEDRLIVRYEGSVLFDTGCVGTNGTWSETISYSGSSTQVTVEAIPNCAGGSGTAWEFTVHCPM